MTLELKRHFSLKTGKHILLLFPMLFFASVTLSAQTTTWDGSESSDWNTAANWNNGVPTSAHDVVIPGNVSHHPVITTSVIVDDLVIGDWNNPAELVIDGGSLTVNRNVSLQNYGGLVMNSGSIHFNNLNSNQFSQAYTDAYIELHSGTFVSDMSLQINSFISTGSADITINGDVLISSEKEMSSGISGNWDIIGNLTVNGKLDLNGASLDVQNTFSVTSGGVVYSGNGNHHFNGLFNVGNSGIFHGEDAYIVVESSITAQSSTYLSINDGTLEIRGNVELKSSAVLEILGTGTIIIMGSGEFKQNGTVNIGNGELQILGDVNFKQGGTLNLSSGTIDISGNASFQQDGNMSIETGTVSIGGTAEFNQSGTLTADDATINISGDLTLGSNGATFNAGGSEINLSGGNFTNNGTFNADSSTVTLSGGTDQTITGDVVFYNLNVETQGELEVNGNIIVVNDAAIDSSSTVSIPDPEDQINVQGELTDPNDEVISVNRPMIRNITYVSANQVMLEFNAGITESTAGNTGNYSSTPALAITAAELQSNPKFILLTFSEIQAYQEYEFLFVNLVSAISGDEIGPDHKKRYTHVQAPAGEPEGATNFTVTDRSDVSISISWDKGAGIGTLIVVRRDKSITGTPANGSLYEADGTLGLGDEWNEGEWVIYSGTAESAEVTGLIPNRNYHFALYTYNLNDQGSPSYTPEALLDSVPTHFRLSLKLKLQGPMNEAGFMETTLNNTSLLPLNQPYAEGFGYEGGESVVAIPSEDIVDWVLVSILQADSVEAATQNKIVARKALFLKNDGSIVSLDGVTHPEFEIDYAAPFVVMVMHRNHLPVMAADTLSRNELNNLFDLDFTVDGDHWYGGEASYIVEEDLYLTPGIGAFEMNQIQNLPGDLYEAIWIARNDLGYNRSDIDMNGAVNASDRARFFNVWPAGIILP